MERLFKITNGNLRELAKCNELLNDGWSLGPMFEWGPDARLFVLWRDETAEFDGDEGWRKGPKDDEEDEK